MTSGVRFGAANARMRALKGRLWMPLDLPLLLRAGMTPDGRPLDAADVFGGVTQWYSTFIAMYPSGARLFRALVRRHEVENLKLLWRSAVRARVMDARCWRSMGPLTSLTPPSTRETVDELVRRLVATPYGPIARTLLRSHFGDLPATEIGLDRWAWTAIDDEQARLPVSEAAARRLVRLLVLEHDLELLRRGTSFGLAADMVAKSTVVLSRECRVPALSAAAQWRPETAPLSTVLVAPLAKLAPGARTWDEAHAALRRARRRACRRAFVTWPFQLAPAVATLLLREEQARAALAIAAARSGLAAAQDALPLALSAGALEG